MLNKKEDNTKILPKKQNEVSTNSQDEIGGRTGPEPTRYGDWENNGKCVDF